jgi:hypothetical protein
LLSGDHDIAPRSVSWMGWIAVPCDSIIHMRYLFCAELSHRNVITPPPGEIFASFGREPVRYGFLNMRSIERVALLEDWDLALIGQRRNPEKRTAGNERSIIAAKEF